MEVDKAVIECHCGLWVVHEHGKTVIFAHTATGKRFIVASIDDSLVDHFDTAAIIEVVNSPTNPLVDKAANKGMGIHIQFEGPTTNVPKSE